MKWEDSAVDTLLAITAHIAQMERAVAGMGPEAMRPVCKTQGSLVRALSTLCTAEVVWADSYRADNFSFGGRMPGGIVFGMIARLEPGNSWEWTFHS